MTDDVEGTLDSSSPSPGRGWRATAVMLTFLTLGAVALFAVLQAGDDGKNPAGTAVERTQIGVLDANPPEVGKLAPDFALVDARDGRTVRRLSDYRGKTVVLNWYASWCGPCQAEIPDFQQAYMALNGEIVILAVNLQESGGKASAMLEGLGATFPSVLDSDGDVARHYRLLGMPSTFFIDRDGILRMFGSGRITGETLRSELAKLGHTY